MRSLRLRLSVFAESVAALLFLAMFAAFLIQVFARYVLNNPIGWTQESVLIAYIGSCSGAARFSFASGITLPSIWHSKHYHRERAAALPSCSRLSLQWRS